MGICGGNGCDAVHSRGNSTLPRALGWVGNERDSSLLRYMDTPSNQPFLRQLLPYFLWTAAAVAVAVALVLCWTKPELDDVGLELVKSLVQVATVLILGQVLTIIVKDREHAREALERELSEARGRRATLTVLHTDVLTKLSNAFVRVKGSRRLLRAEALTLPWEKKIAPATHVRRDPYNEQMKAINAAELELESLWHQLTTTSPTPERATLVANVETMKNYLREILFNYEQVMPQFVAKGADQLPIDEFRDDSEYGTLVDFIDAAKGTQFRERFVKPFRASSGAIREALLSSSEL